MAFETFEDNFQSKFDKIELPFDPQVVVTVHLQAFKKHSGGIRDLLYKHCQFDFLVSCPKTCNRRFRTLKNHRVPQNAVASGIAKMVSSKDLINQTFKFVIPKTVSPVEEIPIEFEISVDKVVLARHLSGKQTIDASELPRDGTVTTKTLTFKKFKVDLDVAISRSIKFSPDFRYSLGLSPEERSFRKKRIPFVREAMKGLLGEENSPRSDLETPIVSLVGSGGGYRAVAGMCGAMEALKDAGLLGVFTYNSGLSGSSWYLASAYALKGVKPGEQEVFHNTLRERFTQNSIRAMILPQTTRDYENSLQRSCKKHGQPYTFANYFPGYIVGKQLLDNMAESKLSQMIPYVEDGSVPYPILVALQVKSRIRSSDYHAYMERTPYEISFPSYGVNISTKDDASTWYKGIRVLQCPEHPLHCTIAMTGCAFSILINSYRETGGELDEDFLKHIEQQRLKGKRKSEDSDVLSVCDDIASDDEDQSSDVDRSRDRNDDVNGHLDKDDCKYSNGDDTSNCDPTATESLNDDVFHEQTAKSFAAGRLNRATIKQLKKSNPEFISRNAIVGRTVRLPNFALGLDHVRNYHLSPFRRDTFSRGSSNSSESGIAIGVTNLQHRLSASKDFLSIADAGVLNNVATDIVLRPQRATDVMIVMDFNAYESDDHFDYQPLLVSSTQAKQSGIEYPEINFESITNLPPKEFLFFPSHGLNCPTILWFTLSNKKFRQLEDYVPKSTAAPPDGETRQFNDFKVFGEGSPFVTTRFQYLNYHFDQLRELMYYNVTSHVEEIKEAISQSIEQKRTKFSSK